MNNSRLPIAIGVLVVLIGGTVFALNARNQRLETPETAAEAPELPEIDRDGITELVLSRPGDENPDGTRGERTEVRLVREGEGEEQAWAMVEPTRSPANQDNVGRLLDALGELEVERVAATRSDNHERLQVTPELGVHVIAKAGDDTVVDFWLGSYGNNSTMMRLEGEDQVIAVRGNIKYHFNRQTREWRNRRLVDHAPNDVVAVQFQNGENEFHFVRPEGANTWELADGMEPIEDFASSKVQSIVASLGRLRANDFAPADVTAETAGLTDPAATVTLIVDPGRSERVATGDEAEGEEPAEGEEAAEGEEPAEGEEVDRVDNPYGEDAETVVVELGTTSSDPAGRYARVRGGEFIYVLSAYTAGRIMPTLESFQGTEEAAPAVPAGGGSPMQVSAMDIPPEILQQLQQQLSMAQ